jgi:hypothetical protein
VTNQLPYPAHSGGQLREAQLLARVGRTVDVDLFVLTESYDRDARHARLALAHCRSVRLFESRPTPGDGPADDVPERVWRYDSAAFDAVLREHLAASPPDVVHVEGYFLAEHLPADLPVPVVIVTENVECSSVPCARKTRILSVTTPRGYPCPFSPMGRIIWVSATSKDPSAAHRQIKLPSSVTIRGDPPWTEPGASYERYGRAC